MAEQSGYYIQLKGQALGHESTEGLGIPSEVEGYARGGREPQWIVRVKKTNNLSYALGNECQDISQGKHPGMWENPP